MIKQLRERYIYIYGINEATPIMKNLCPSPISPLAGIKPPILELYGIGFSRWPAGKCMEPKQIKKKHIKTCKPTKQIHVLIFFHLPCRYTINTRRKVQQDPPLQFHFIFDSMFIYFFCII